VLADALPLGQQIHGSVLSYGERDQDLFAIDMPAAGALRLNLTYAAGMGDLDTHHVSVFDAERALVTTFALNGRDADGKRLSSMPVPLPAGRAYVRVLADATWPSWGTEYVFSATRVSVPTSTVTRLAGADRYSTAVSIAQASFQPGVAKVYVSSGLDFPDALSGAPVAAMNGAPILLVRPTSIPSVVIDELKRLRPQQIIVLGGAGAVSEKVRAQLGALTSGSVTRVAGSDRYATSAAISRASFSASSVVYLATGDGFPDALSGAPVAGMNKHPVLLVKRDSIPAPVAAELARLSPSEIIVLGGEGVISSRVTDGLPIAQPYAVRRLSGQDRYGTSAGISRVSFRQGPAVAYIATGLTFSDALAAAAVAGMQKGPVLLVAPGSIPVEVRSELQRLKPHSIVVLGGSGAVSEGVKAELAQFAIP
jgi:putative cell wall-binding protein